MRHDRASATAVVVAQNLALVADAPELSHLVSTEAARLNEALLAAYGRPRSLRRRVTRRMLPLFERCSIPGLALHQALRKHHIEQLVRTALAQRYEQVVVIGGGLDTLALRLHLEFPDVNFIELDHPATQRIKAHLAATRPIAAANLTLHPVELGATSLTAALDSSGAFARERRTVFICEGVLMYLTADDVDSLFAAVRTQAAPAVRFIFTFMEPDAAGRPAFRSSTPLVRLWLALKSEPFRWALARDALREFLAARGFAAVDVANEETFRNAYLRDGLRRRTVAAGELVCAAERLAPTGAASS